MKTTWTIGKKLAAVFSGVAALTLLLGGVGYYGADRGDRAVTEVGFVRLPSVDSLLQIKANAETIRGTVRTLIIPGLATDIRNRQYDNLAMAREAYGAAWKIYEPLPQTPEEAALWKEFVPAWNAWREENNRFIALSKRFDGIGITDPTGLARQIEQFTKDHYILLHRVRDLLENETAEFEGGEDHTGCNAGKYLPGFQTENPALTNTLKEFAGPHRQFHEAIAKFKRLMEESKTAEAGYVYTLEILPAMEAVFKQFNSMLALANEAVALADEMKALALGPVRQQQLIAIGLLDRIVRINQDVAAETAGKARNQAAFVKQLVSVAGLLGLLAALACGYFITRNINKALKRIIDGLTEGAEQVSSASGQVSSASQSLAEGASEQAASIEESSSSLEEMSSMTKQNADNANQANTLMVETKQVVGTANDSMARLTESMREISKASEDTSKIIKTIDEIAFQTNLLALNAAVEAARAGEAGAGFAVVADEVRNLAMRASEAAKNTADLIEGTVKKVKDGSELVERTNEAFQQVAVSSTKVGQLVGEIAASSNEQAQGIEQINKAVTEMDKVTQQNAANAEESASASEEMNAQAEQMKGMVDELVAMVGGASNNNRRTDDVDPRLQLEDGTSGRG